MEMEGKIKEAKLFCNQEYSNQFKHEYDLLSSIKDEEEKVRKAQKKAIQMTLFEALSKFPDIVSVVLWDAIYGAHVHRRTNIDDIEIIEIVISAAQSWKKSSGHAFEEFIKDNASKALKDTPIKIVLQRDLCRMIHQELIQNEKRDIEWLAKRLIANTFDLYALIEQEGKWKCFGCIQSKTSIRDRVTRDREPSITAMKHFFWSVCVTLDGDFLKQPKFKGMVNGGIDEFPTNGWHGMYVLSNFERNDRIYPIDLSFEVFKKHAVEAANYWLTQRQWFNCEWKASDE